MEAVIFAVPWLAARLNVQRFHKRIEDLENGSTYRALASAGASVHGLASSFIVCDELGQWKQRALFDVLRTSMGKRREPLLMAIGTRPDERRVGKWCVMKLRSAWVALP